MYDIAASETGSVLFSFPCGALLGLPGWIHDVHSVLAPGRNFIWIGGNQCKTNYSKIWLNY
jgi:hypothetical protein